MLRTTLLLVSGHAGTALVLLMRMLVLAWLLPLADYGIAASFALAMALVEMACGLGLPQQMVQAPEGEAPRYQAALQGLQLARGVLAGGLLLLLAGPIAAFLAIPEATGGLQVLALVPVLGGLQHFDIHRLGRQHRMGPGLLAGFLPALASLLALWPLHAWLGDWRIMPATLLIQSAGSTLASHLLARRPYRLAHDRAVTREALRLGGPILMNGLVLFAVFQGDRLIVGRSLGIEAMGLFAMAATLSLTPALVLARSLQALVLPILSRTTSGATIATPRAETPQLAAAGAAAGVLHAVAGVALGLGALALGPALERFVLGPKFEGLAALLAGLGVAQGLRLMRGGAATLALARGQSGRALVANLVRLLGLGATVLILPGAGSVAEGLTIVTLMAVASEALASLLALALMQPAAQGRARWRLLGCSGLAALSLGAGLSFGLGGAEGWPVGPESAMVLALGCALGAALALQPAWRDLAALGPHSAAAEEAETPSAEPRRQRAPEDLAERAAGSERPPREKASGRAALADPVGPVSR